MSALSQALDDCTAHLAQIAPVRVEGRVSALVGTVVHLEGIRGELGSLVRLEPASGRALLAEIVGFDAGRSVAMPLGDATGVAAGTPVAMLPRGASQPAGDRALGRVIDALGRPLDGGPPLAPRSVASTGVAERPLLGRRRIDKPLDVGVRAINALCTIGCGARIGLFSSSGVGKSTLLGQIARGTRADSVVVALIGERGREVRDFVEEALGPALPRSIVVAATSDAPPALRRRAAWLASDLAEDLRARGDHVLFLMDSLSRFAAAQREIGLAAGEPPATRGYPPSVWSAIPRLVERAGTCEGPGSISALYTVLVEGEVNDDPIADAIRSFLDGHLVLSRKLAERGQYPAIDPLASVSRVMRDVLPAEAVERATRARAALAGYASAEDLISIGAYQPGHDARTDEAVRLEPVLRDFLAQAPDQLADLESSLAALGASLQGGSA